MKTTIKAKTPLDDYTKTMTAWVKDVKTYIVF